MQGNEASRSAAVSTYRMANHCEPRSVLFIKDDERGTNDNHGQTVGIKWSESENDPPIAFDGNNLIFNKKLDFRKNIDAPDYMHKLLSEIAISFLNDHKIANGQPFRKELNESLGRILGQEVS